MPNHISNRLTIVAKSEAELEKVLSEIGTEESSLDFNKIIPMPEDLMISGFSHTDAEFLYVKQHDEYNEEEALKISSHFTRGMYENAKLQLENKRKYGHLYWYGWSCENWGTKWNAYDITLTRNSGTEALIEFFTAWSAPLEIFEELSEKYPDVEIFVQWADEDMGYNTGNGYGHNGDFEYDMPVGGSDEAYELYFQCHEWAREEYVRKDGEWVYYEDLEDDEDIDIPDEAES